MALLTYTRIDYKPRSNFYSLSLFSFTPSTRLGNVTEVAILPVRLVLKGLDTRIIVKVTLRKLPVPAAVRNHEAPPKGENNKDLGSS